MQNSNNRMKDLPVIVLLLLLAARPLVAQEEKEVRTQTIHFGTITLVQDERISVLMDRQITLNKRKGGIDGYRIQVFFNSGRDAREEAIHVKADFLSEYPDIPVYIIYQSPFYKVRIGDFRSKYEALGVFSHIRRKYPSAYIVKDVIPFPDLDKAEK